MAERQNDLSGYDRVLLISAADLKTRATDSRFDPLHPVFYRTEGADPFDYANRFCQMRLTEEGTVNLRRMGEPERFGEEWEALFEAVSGWTALTDIRIYDFNMEKAPAAVALTTYGRVQVFGGCEEFLPARFWPGVTTIYWDVDGFGALCEDDVFRAVGGLKELSGTDEVEEIACSALPGHCSPIAYLLQKNGTVSLFDRKNHTVTRPRERVQQIALVKYNPYGVSTWVALSKITGRFLCSEPRDSISADFFGGDYTDIIAPNRFRQKIRAIAAVPRKYLAVLYENGYLRVFGAGYNSGDILCEDVEAIELSEDELIAYLPSDLSYAPAIEFDEDDGDLANALCSVELGAPVDLEAASGLLRERVDGWITAEKNAVWEPLKKIIATRRNSYYIYFLFEDGTVRSELLTYTGHSGFGENEVSDWKNVKEIYPGRFQTLALTHDGRALTAGCGYGVPYHLEDWKGLAALRQSGGLAAGLKADGTVVAQRAEVGLLIPGVSQWRDIVQIELGEDYLVGLKKDGTVVAAGNDTLAGLSFWHWQGIQKIAVAEEVIAGLTEDGRVLTAGKSFRVPLRNVENWRNIKDLIAFQNGGTILMGLTEDGTALTAGRWNNQNFSSEDALDHEKWSGLTRIWQDGYYLLGEKKDGSLIYESSPTDRVGDPPQDEHITDWSDITHYIIGGEYLLAIRSDGTVAWEGARRRREKLAVTEKWRNITQCILWNNAGGRSNALAVDRNGQLYSDMVASGFNAKEHQNRIDAFFGGFSGVKKLLLFMPFLAVLHETSLSFIYLPEGKLARIDLPDVQDVLSAEEGETIVVTFTDGRVRSFGSTLYSSEIDFSSTEVRFYGDRTEYTEEGKDQDPFRHFEGIVGVDPRGTPFVLSPRNHRESENYYKLQDLLRLDKIEGAVAIEPLGDLLMLDGTCRSKRGDLFAKWVGIRQLSSCFTHAIGVTTFNTVVVKGDGEYGSCSVDAYMGVNQAFSLPHATVLLLDNGTLISLCEKLSETPYEPLPVTKGVSMLAKTNGYFAILTKEGELWYCEAQAFADKIRWRGSSEYYTRPWGPWKKLCDDAYRMTVTGESIRVFRREKGFSYMEPTLEQNTLTGYEPTLG